MSVDFIRLTAKQVQELPPTQTVFFFPVGPIEDHGPHLPIGLDISEADYLCRMAAERLEREMPGWVGVVMPAGTLGVSSNTSALALTVRGYVLRDWLVDSCRSLTRAGFRHYVCFSGQLGPRQLTTIEEAGKRVMRRGPITWLRSLFAPVGSPAGTRPTFASACSALANARHTRESPLWSDPMEHGARRDTSVALALGWMNRQPITPATATALKLVQAPRCGSLLTRGWELLTGKRSGYWGLTSPTEGTAPQGEAILRGSLDEIFPKLRAVWEGTHPNQLFRSWYSILPPNQSFFKAWLLGILILAMMLAWLYLSVQSILPG